MDEVSRFVGIVFQVEKFGFKSHMLDVFPIAPAQHKRARGAAVAVVLAHGPIAFARRRRGQLGQEGFTVEGVGIGRVARVIGVANARHVQKCRVEIDEGNGRIDHAAALDLGAADDQGNVGRGFVHRAFEHLVLIAGHFAVVARENDVRVVAQSQVVNRLQYPPDHLI